MLLINFNLEHGIWEGLKNLTLYLDLVLFWHSFLSLAAGLTLFLYLLNSLLDIIMIAKSIKWQQLTLLQPTTNYSTNFNSCPESSLWPGNLSSFAALMISCGLMGNHQNSRTSRSTLLKYRHFPRS